MNKLTAIAAVARNGVIGVNSGMPWQLPADFARFKQVTMGGNLVMGRVTYESIGRLLPGRVSIVLSRQGGEDATDLMWVADIEQALLVASQNGRKTFIIGGAQIYRLAWPYLTELDITEVEQEPVGDAYFPKIDPKEWAQVSRDQREGFAFVTYHRI